MKTTLKRVCGRPRVSVEEWSERVLSSVHAAIRYHLSLLSQEFESLYFFGNPIGEQIQIDF